MKQRSPGGPRLANSTVSMDLPVLGPSTPCFNCPFRRSTQAVRVLPERAAEICDLLVQGGSPAFVCHKTRGGNPGGPKHCAGALVFARKNRVMTAAMQIAERLGGWDRDEPLSDPEIVDAIFDTRAEMIEAQERHFA